MCAVAIWLKGLAQAIAWLDPHEAASYHCWLPQIAPWPREDHERHEERCHGQGNRHRGHLAAARAVEASPTSWRFDGEGEDNDTELPQAFLGPYHMPLTQHQRHCALVFLLPFFVKACSLTQAYVLGAFLVP